MNSHHIVHSAPASASRKPAMTGSAAGAGANAAGLSGEFAGLFGALMGGSPGQDLAALSGKTTPAVEGLAAQALGPEVNIITASKPSTSDDSLLAFARSQGLDESALAMIFQQRAGAAADNLQRADALSDKATAEEATAAKAAAATAVANMVDLGDEQSMRWSLGKAEDPAATLQAQSATSEILKPVLFGLNGARAGNQLANAGQAAAANAEAQDEAGDGMEQGMAASLSLGDGVAQFAKRMQARTGEARGTQAPQAALAALAGGGSGADSLDASQPTTAESLVVGEDLTGDDLQAICAQRAEAATAARDVRGSRADRQRGRRQPSPGRQRTGTAPGTVRQARPTPGRSDRPAPVGADRARRVEGRAGAQAARPRQHRHPPRHEGRRIAGIVQRHPRRHPRTAGGRLAEIERGACASGHGSCWVGC